MPTGEDAVALTVTVPETEPAEGLVRFIDNPRHRRSKLVRLTAKGDARYCEWSARLLAIASTMGARLSELDIRRTIGDRAAAEQRC